MAKYQLAFCDCNGDWDIVEEFEAVDNDAANAWAEANEDRMETEYDNSEWWILNANGDNING